MQSCKPVVSDENYKLSRLKDGISRIAEEMHATNTDEINKASDMDSECFLPFPKMIASDKRSEEF